MFKRALILTSYFLGTLGLICYEPVIAQIIPDNSLGVENSVITPNITINGVPSDRIDGGAVRGQNLFHSFQEFNINEGRGAFFDTSSTIDNVLGRVTGTSPSNILGTLGVLGEANLFLLNPNGLIFGPNARLDLRGSFVGSTAEAIKFSDSFEFGSNNTVPPLLIIDVPIGLRFSNNSGNISTEDTFLSVGQDRTLALIGGKLNLLGGILEANGGTVELGSIAPESIEISINETSDGFSFIYPSEINLSDIQLLDGIRVAANEPEGNINIRARKLKLNDGSIISTTTFSNSDAGSIDISTSDSIELSDSDTTVFAQVAENAQGAGGIVNIDTSRLTLRDGAGISTTTFGRGNAGPISITADSIEFLGGRGDGLFGRLNTIQSLVAEDAVGDGGDITIQAQELKLGEGSQISTSTFGEGDAGNLLITTTRLVELIGPEPEVVSQTITNDGITIFRELTPPEFPTALFTRVGSNSNGTGGNIVIKTGSLKVENGSLLSTTSFGSGNAGNIFIDASESVDLFLGSGLFARSEGEAISGSIEISADNLIVNNSSQILTESSLEDGGDIIINVGDTVVLRRESLISATAGTSLSRGNSGDIIINADFVVASFEENSDIVANAFSGRGGNISIDALALLGISSQPNLTENSDITASSSLGVSGEILINVSESDLSRGLASFPEEKIDISSVIPQICLNSSDEENDSFIIDYDTDIPFDPGLEINMQGSSSSIIPTQIIEPTGWIRAGDSFQLRSGIQNNASYSYNNPSTISCDFFNQSS